MTDPAEDECHTTNNSSSSNDNDDNNNKSICNNIENIPSPVEKICAVPKMRKDFCYLVQGDRHSSFPGQCKIMSFCETRDEAIENALDFLYNTLPTNYALEKNFPKELVIRTLAVHDSYLSTYLRVTITKVAKLERKNGSTIYKLPPFTLKY